MGDSCKCSRIIGNAEKTAFIRYKIRVLIKGDFKIIQLSKGNKIVKIKKSRMNRASGTNYVVGRKSPN